MFLIWSVKWSEESVASVAPALVFIAAKMQVLPGEGGKHSCNLHSVVYVLEL